MKKSFFFALSFTALVAACNNAPLNGDFKGVVSELTDSVLVFDVKGTTNTVDATNAQLTNGVVQAGDSVIVRCSDGKAVYIHLLPQASHVVIPNEMRDNELLTRPEPVVQEEETAE